MSVKIQIAALKEGRFKKPITFKIPTEEVHKNGNTVYQNAHILATFVNVSEEKRIEHQKALNELHEKNRELNDDESASFEDKSAIEQQIKALNISFIQDFFVGFEKHPKHPFPFLDGETELASTHENIAALLEIRLIREQIDGDYWEEVSAKQTARVTKLLGGNSLK